jgi:hypothetical protein
MAVQNLKMVCMTPAHTAVRAVRTGGHCSQQGEQIRVGIHVSRSARTSNNVQ